MRLAEAGVDIVLSQVLTSAGSGAVELACAYTGRPMTLPADALVLLTARLPDDELATTLRAAEGGPTVRALGDALAPGTIAAAVWDGHRYAEELDDPAVANNDLAPFKREVVALADE